MTYRTSLTLSFSTIAVILSLILATISYRTNMSYERQAQENITESAAESIAQQMEDRLDRMDTIMDYILSNSSVIDSILLLGLEDETQVPASEHLTSLKTIELALTTDYINKQSYRTIFYNRSGAAASSFVTVNMRLRDIDPSTFSYLQDAEDAKGSPVLVGSHTDRWNAAYPDEEVYSLVMAVQGHNAGFIEVENTIESLQDLNQNENDAEFIIELDDGEILACSDGIEDPENWVEKIEEENPEDGSVEDGSGWFYCSRHSESRGFRIIVLRPLSVMDDLSHSLLLSSFVMAMVIFGICLAVIVFSSYLLTIPLSKLEKIISTTNYDNLKESDPSLDMNHAPREFKNLAKAWEDMKVRLSDALQKERRASLLQLQAQFDSLQAQVNPHFIYNVLNIISSRGVMDDDEKISEMCGALASMLRYTTGNKERYTRVSDDLAYCKHYFYLLKARYEDRISFSIDVDEEVQKSIIPKATLQQIVENSIGHGFANTKDTMQISIRGKMEKDRWILEIRDNGDGFDETSLKKLEQEFAVIRERFAKNYSNVEMEIGGMGLRNVYARCYILYSTNLIFELRNDNGAVVTLGCSIDPSVQEGKEGK